MRKNKADKRSYFPGGKNRKNQSREPLTEKELVVALIKDDLVNYRLLMGLDQLGLVTELYFINLSQTVFNYMGIESENEGLSNYARYEQLKSEVMRYDLLSGRKKLNLLAERIYRELVSMKFMQQQ